MPLQLVSQGEVTITQRDLSLAVAHLFTLKSSINLTSCIIETPLFLTDLSTRYPSLLQAYQIARTHLQIESRVNVLNARIAVVGELLTLLKKEQHEREAVYLEWCVIILIAVDAVVMILQVG